MGRIVHLYVFYLGLSSWCLRPLLDCYHFISPPELFFAQENGQLKLNVQYVSMSVISQVKECDYIQNFVNKQPTLRPNSFAKT